MFSKFNTMLDEVREINRKQYTILARITTLEYRVNGQDQNITALKEEVANIKSQVNKDFDPEVTLVVTNQLRYVKDNPLAYSCRLLDSLGRPATIVDVLHTQPRDNSNGVLKIELGSKEEKIDVLRHKTSLKDTHDFKSIYIRSSKTHTDRVMDYNFKTIITELMPDTASHYRIAGNGKLIKKTGPYNNPQPAISEQAWGYHRQSKASNPLTKPTSPRKTAQRVQFSAVSDTPKQTQPGEGTVAQRMGPFYPLNNGFPVMVPVSHSSQPSARLQRRELQTQSGIQQTSQSVASQNQMNFHDGSRNGSYSQLPYGTSPSVLQPTVPPYLPRNVSTHYSTPRFNLTQNGLDGSTYY